MNKKKFHHFLIGLTLILFRCDMDFSISPHDDVASFPTPVTSLNGWELNELNTGLKNDYTALQDINPDDVGTLSGNTLYIIKNDIIIANKRIPYIVLIQSDNVIFEQCLFNPTTCGVGIPLVRTDGEKNVVFKDCEMDFSGIPLNEVYMSIGVSIECGKLYRCIIHGSSTGLHINNGTDKAAVVEGCYIHGLRYQSPAHVDGITIRECDNNGCIAIYNNKVIVDTSTATGAIFIQATSSFINNILISGNLFEGTNYNFILEYSNGGYGMNMRSRNNRLNPYTFYGGNPAYGYVEGGPGWKQWNDNYAYVSDGKDCKGKKVTMRTIDD